MACKVLVLAEHDAAGVRDITWELLGMAHALASGAGWGAEIPDMLRNGNWHYAVFTLDKKPRPGVNQAECLACHKPLDGVSYTFTLKELSQAK